MKVSRKPTIVATVVLVASLAASIGLLRRLDEVRRGATIQDSLYIPSPQAVKRLSLGYSGFMADLYWTRAVQYFGGKHHEGSTEYKLLGPLLEITTTLDPQLLVAYEYGSNFMADKPPQGAGDPEGAVNLVKFGIRNNPEQWRLYYDLGFIYYLNLKDYRGAAEAFEKASQLPNAHPFTKILAGKMAQHAGEYQMARMLWSATYESAQEESIKYNAIAHLRALRVDEDVTHLEEAVAAYRQKTGSSPGSLSALVNAGLLPGVPLDPDRHPYKITADGRVEVQNPDDFFFITKGTPPSYKAPPVNFDRFKK